MTQASNSHFALINNAHSAEFLNRGLHPIYGRLPLQHGSLKIAGLEIALANRIKVQNHKPVRCEHMDRVLIAYGGCLGWFLTCDSLQG